MTTAAPSPRPKLPCHFSFQITKEIRASPVSNGVEWLSYSIRAEDTTERIVLPLCNSGAFVSTSAKLLQTCQDLLSINLS
jgi:hypothetical protein